MSDIGNLPVKTRKLGTHEYRTMMLPLGQWFELEELALDAFGDPLEKLFGAMPVDAVTGQVNLMSLETEKIAEVLHQILRGTGARRLQRLVDSMAGHLEVRGGDGHWRKLTDQDILVHFRLHMRELIPALLFFLEVQFADFFGGALSLLGEIPKVERPNSSDTEGRSKDLPPLSPSPQE